MLEVAVIVGIAVMLFPPSELPKIARGVARFYGMIRRTADDFRHAILNDDDLREPFQELKGAYDGARNEFERAREEARREIAKARMEARIAARKNGTKMQSTPDPRGQLGPRAVPSETQQATVARGDALAEEADEAEPVPRVRLAKTDEEEGAA